MRLLCIEKMFRITKYFHYLTRIVYTSFDEGVSYTFVLCVCCVINIKDLVFTHCL